MGRAQADITRLQAELDALSPVPGAAAAARERAAELEAELARGREELAALRGAAGGGRAALAERYRELVRRREETEAALKQLEARYPGGLPDEIVQKWNDALEELYADETFLQEMADLGLMPDYKNSADFEAFFRENLETISAVAEKNGLVK